MTDFFIVLVREMFFIFPLTTCTSYRSVPHVLLLLSTILNAHFHDIDGDLSDHNFWIVQNSDNELVISCSTSILISITPNVRWLLSRHNSC